MIKLDWMIHESDRGTPTRIMHSGEPTVEEIEGYKQDWKKNGFPDPDYGLQHNGGVDRGNEKTRPVLGEEMLWTAYVRALFDDYRGVPPYAKQPCLDCHEECEPKCGCVVDGRVHRQKWLTHCPNHHTNQDCAKFVLLESPEFAQILEWIGLDVEYFRDRVRQGKFRVDSMDIWGHSASKQYKHHRRIKREAALASKEG